MYKFVLLVALAFVAGAFAEPEPQYWRGGLYGGNFYNRGGFYRSSYRPYRAYNGFRRRYWKRSAESEPESNAEADPEADPLVYNAIRPLTYAAYTPHVATYTAASPVYTAGYHAGAYALPTASYYSHPIYKREAEAEADPESYWAGYYGGNYVRPYAAVGYSGAYYRPTYNVYRSGYYW